MNKLLRSVAFVAACAVLPACGGGAGGGSVAPPVFGDLAPGFGAGGIVRSNPTASGDWVTSSAIDGSFLYLVGSDFSPGAVLRRSQWRLEKRRLVDGALDPAFGGGGVITADFSDSEESATAMAMDGTYMYVAGFDSILSPTYPEWRIEKRLLSDGSLVPAFGAGGAVTSNPSVFGGVPAAMAIDGTFMYVVGYDVPAGGDDWEWRIEKRTLSDGSLVPTFGVNGVVTNNPSPVAFGYDAPTVIVIDDTFMYVGGYDSALGPGNAQWRIEKRQLSDGSLSASFGTGGVVLSNPGPRTDQISSLAIDTQAMYVVGNDSSLGSAATPISQWRIEKRNLSDGGLVGTFGTAGVVTGNASGSNGAADVKLASPFLYILGSDAGWRLEKRDPGSGVLVAAAAADVSGFPVNLQLDPEFAYLIGDGTLSGGADVEWRVEKRLR